MQNMRMRPCPTNESGAGSKAGAGCEEGTECGTTSLLHKKKEIARNQMFKNRTVTSLRVHDLSFLLSPYLHLGPPAHTVLLTPTQKTSASSIGVSEDV